METTVIDREAWVVTVSELLAPAECAEWIRFAEGVGFEDAPLTVGSGFVYSPGIRNNTRVIVDDVARATALWDRVRPHVPVSIDDWRAAGLNERLRVYRYEPGQYFRWHYDGCFERSERERSFVTVMVYLNGGLGGGATELADLGAVTPETGKLLLFRHAVYHQGAPVTRGRKYVLRSDVMYRRGP